MNTMNGILDITIQPVTWVPSENEERQLQEIFHQPIVQKYLRNMMFAKLVDLVVPSQEVLAQQPVLYQVNQAFIKGCIGTLQTLVTMDKPAPPKQPTTQQGVI